MPRLVILGTNDEARTINNLIDDYRALRDTRRARNREERMREAERKIAEVMVDIAAIWEGDDAHPIDGVSS